jgi:hypothetical protein
MGGTCSTGMRNAYRILIGKPEGKRPLLRHRGRRGRNIKMDLKKIGLERMDWINLAHDRGWQRAVMNTVTKLRVLCLFVLIKFNLEFT